MQVTAGCGPLEDILKGAMFHARMLRVAERAWCMPTSAFYIFYFGVSMHTTKAVEK